MCHNEYRRRVCRSGDNDLGILFVSFFFWKDKNPLTHHRISKYNSGQEIRIESPESSDVREREIPKFLTCKRRVNSSRDGGRWYSQSQSPSGAQGRKKWQTEKLRWHQLLQNQGFSQGPWYHQTSSYPTLQKHRCLAECTRYYGNGYIIVRYGILQFLTCTL